MFVKASLATLFTVSLLTAYGIAQAPQNSLLDSVNSSPLGLRGKVLSPDGKPASGIHIEVDEVTTAIPVTSTYTERDGSFALYNIPTGSYEVVAESKDSLVSDTVTVQPGAAQLDLRLPRNQSPVSAFAPTVSVAQMMVPEGAQKHYRKANAAFTKGDLDKAREQVDAALMIEPQYPDALTLRAFIAMQKGDLNSAQQYLERAVHIDPNCSEAYIGLGAVYNHQGRFDDAMRASQRSLTLSPKSWQAYFEMAKANIAKGMYARGLQFARQAQRLSGNSFAAIHLVKAYALIPMRFYKDARYEVQAFLSHEPKGTSAEQAQALLAQIDADMPAPATR